MASAAAAFLIPDTRYKEKKKGTCACQCALQTTSHAPVTRSCGPGSRAASPPRDLSGPRLKGDSGTDDGASGQEEVEVRPRLSVSPSSFSRWLRLEALSGPAGAVLCHSPALVFLPSRPFRPPVMSVAAHCCFFDTENPSEKYLLLIHSRLFLC